MTLIVYHMPGACSSVTLVALEQCGIDYEDRSVSLMQGEQNQPKYLAVNPKGKVPVLIADGAAITETPVILNYLARLHPQARLLPLTGNSIAELVGLSDLVWCAGALHPLVHRVFRPSAYSTASSESVKDVAIGQLDTLAQSMSARLTAKSWWYGADWSIVDTYIAWCFETASQFGFPLASHPNIEEHGRRSQELLSYRKMKRRERNAISRDKIAMPPWYA